MRYIDQNVRQSGMEIWRKLNRSSNTCTYNTIDVARRAIKGLGVTRCKNMTELMARHEMIEAAMQQYLIIWTGARADAWTGGRMGGRTGGREDGRVGQVGG